MGKKLLYSYIKERIERKGYKLLSTTYKNATTKLRIQCKHNPQHIFEMCWHNFQKGHRCGICGGKYKLTYEFIKGQIESIGYTLISTEYKDNKTPITVKCDKNHEYETTWKDWRQNHRCKKCYHENRKLDFNYVKTEIEKEPGYVLLSTEYVGSQCPLSVKCDKDHVYTTTWDCFKSGRRCPKCKCSKGEKAIEKYLKSIGLEYITQYRDPRCRNILPLPFDFYIKKINMLMEFDGDEHKMPIDFFGGEEKFEQVKKNDTIKNQFCIDNQIVLLRISYKNLNRIEEILSSILRDFIIYHCFFSDELKITNYLIQM